MVSRKDREILQHLATDSRQSVRSIARKMKVSAVTVLKHIKAMQAQQIIRGFTCDLDYDRLGYEFPAIIRVSVAKGRLAEVQQRIARDPNVHAVYDVTGDFDTVVVGRWKSRKGLDTFVKRLQTYQNVTRTQTNLILNTVKDASQLIQ